MTPESDDYLHKAYGDLDDARKILAIPLEKIAARSAYFAAFHAAEAYVLEHTGKVAKTHSGVRTELARLLKKNHGVKYNKLTAFLARAYSYQELPDYSTAPGKGVSALEAADAVEAALQFVDCIKASLDEARPGSTSP